MAKFLTSLLVLGLAALALQATASVLPDANAKPNPMADGGVAEVMPGPGMPSLKELNLTSVQLSAMGKPEAGILPRGRLERRRQGCGPKEAMYTNVKGAVTCYHYMRGKPEDFTWDTYPARRMTSPCSSAGSGVLIGSLTGLKATATAWSIADAALWIIDHCTRPDGNVAGYTHVDGKLGFVVAIGVNNYFAAHPLYAGEMDKW